jgi:hypothetical protein
MKTNCLKREETTNGKGIQEESQDAYKTIIFQDTHNKKL